MTKSQAIQHFRVYFSALAKALGVTYEAVRQWADVPEFAPVPDLSVLTKGALKAGKKDAAA
ncbi:Cro/Cl family transcriptional regulator [Pseudomonas putida]|nr:Cro/Cl family transcriptional regulator [Pseudomonas putida]